jgi:hypothetical protein
MAECPKCGGDLEHSDTFGNSTYAIAATGYRSPYFSGEGAIKAGDIWQCTNEECEGNWFYTYASDPGHVHQGYPC